MGRIGGVLSTTVGKLAEFHVAIPTTIFGISAILAALFALALPETARHSLPDNIEECEKNVNRKSRRVSKVMSRRTLNIPESGRDSTIPKA